ncbi:hypothetical protein BC830DRAFT_93235 [Chytriomyces sp. MP71]|nr:hypothetical protein BC830DRAFT_93235 [Chytriomyces sp. MP71]
MLFSVEQEDDGFDPDLVYNRTATLMVNVTMIYSQMPPSTDEVCFGCFFTLFFHISFKNRTTPRDQRRTWRKLAAFDSTLTTEECEKAESKILAGTYMLKHCSVSENYDKHNSATHCWSQRATLDQEGIKIITPHVASLARRDIALSACRNVSVGVLTKLTGELVFFDTEVVAKSHKHADTTIWAF